MNPAPDRPVAVVTGATSGIGAAVARALIGRGFRVVVVSRQEDRCRATVEELRSTGGDAEYIVADLTTAQGCAHVGEVVRARHSAIALLINNAGAIFPEPSNTPDGHERTFALNVVAPYRLATLLGPALCQGAPARVVNIASAAHRGQHLRSEDLEGRGRWGSYSAYGRSKLALILLTRAMAQRSDPGTVAYFAVHPGLVRTRWGAEARPSMRWMVRLGRFVAISPEAAARTVLYAALDPGLAGRSGEYIARERVVRPSRAARDPAMAEHVWHYLERDEPSDAVGPAPPGGS